MLSVSLLLWMLDVDMDVNSLDWLYFNQAGQVRGSIKQKLEIQSQNDKIFKALQGPLLSHLSFPPDLLLNLN